MEFAPCNKWSIYDSDLGQLCYWGKWNERSIKISTRTYIISSNKIVTLSQKSRKNEWLQWWLKMVRIEVEQQFSPLMPDGVLFISGFVGVQINFSYKHEPCLDHWLLQCQLHVRLDIGVNHILIHVLGITTLQWILWSRKLSYVHYFVH